MINMKAHARLFHCVGYHLIRSVSHNNLASESVANQGVTFKEIPVKVEKAVLPFALSMALAGMSAIASAASEDKAASSQRKSTINKAAIDPISAS